MEQALDEYMVVWKQCRREQKENGCVSVEVMERLEELEDYLNLLERGAR